VGPYAKQALGLIHQSGLDRPPHIDRYPVIGQTIGLAGAGRLAEHVARAAIPIIMDIVNEVTVSPNVTFIPDPDKLNADGPVEVELGTTENDLRIGNNPSREVHHILVSGATGTGKTVLLRRLIIGLSEFFASVGQKASIFVIDCKNDFPDLPRIARGTWLSFMAGLSMFMGLQPPLGVDEAAWVGALSNSLASRAGLVASRVTLARIINWLRHAMHVTLKLGDIWPSPEQILQTILSGGLEQWARKADYAKSLTQAIDDLVYNSGKLFVCSGFDLNQLAAQGKHAVINLGRITVPWIRSLLVDILVSQIFHPRRSLQHKTDRTEIVLIIDEADEFVSRHQEQAFFDQTSPISLLLKQGREMGVMAVLSVSVLSRVSPMILANSTDQWMFNQADTESILSAARTLLLPPGGERQISALPPGVAVVRQSLSKWPHAMVVNVDYVPPYRGAPPEYDTHPYVPSKSLEEMPELQTLLQERVAEQKREQLKQIRASKKGLSEAARRLLAAFFSLLFWPVARLWEKAGQVSPSTQKAVRKELEDEGFAEFEEIRITRANVLLMLATQAAAELLACQLPAYRGRGGVAHLHLQNWLAMVGKAQGYESSCEWIVPKTNHPVDAVWNVDGCNHAFEVALDYENILSHINACFVESDAVETLTIVTTQMRFREEVRARVESQLAMSPILNRIKFELISTYMKELWP